MTLSLHTIGKSKLAGKKRKRIGRGNSAGQGTYSGRGQKGQKSRSGAKAGKLKRLGMRQTLLRTPKERGFKSLQAKDQVVNIFAINENFQDQSEINPKTLLKKGLIDSINSEVKILGSGELKLKGLVFSRVKLSSSAKEQVAKQGGKIIGC